MHVGVCRLSLRFAENHSLKEKRQIARSIIDKVRNKFNVAIAEVDDNDMWQRLTLGISCLSNEASHAHQVISQVVDYIQKINGSVEFLDYEVEVVPGP